MRLLVFLLLAASLATLALYARAGTVESTAFYLHWISLAGLWMIGTSYAFRQRPQRMRYGCAAGALMLSVLLLNPVAYFYLGWAFGLLSLPLFFAVAVAAPRSREGKGSSP
jgi:hypothetical protein